MSETKAEEPKLADRRLVEIGGGRLGGMIRPPDHLVIIEEEEPGYRGSSESEGNEPVLAPASLIKPPPFRRGVGPSRLMLWGDPVLEQPAERITDFGPELQSLLGSLWGRLGGLKGYGLAAPQIGVAKAVAMIGMRLPEKPAEPLKIVMCNPVIIQKGRKVRVMEGCLSIPGFFHTIERRHSVTVMYQDEKGETRELKAKGLLAQVVQHEVDHLQGIIMVKYVHERQAKRRAQRAVDDARRAG